MAVEKKKRVSKKTKKSWRKNTDVKDVEEFLDDQRLEERLGGSFVSRKNEDLFEIDTGTEAKVVPKVIYNLKSEGLSVPKRSKRHVEVATPRCFAVLEARSAVPDPVIKRNRVKTREEKRLPVVSKILQRKLEQGIVSAKQRTATRSREEDAARRQKEADSKEFNRDVWSEVNDDKLLNGHSEWCRKDTIRHTLHNTGKRRKTTPRMILKKTSALPAVEAPHPGSSYNPSYKEHQALLSSVVDTEAQLVKEEEHIQRVTTKMFAKVRRDVAEQDWLTEMSAGLAPTLDDSDVEGDYAPVNPPARNRKKTLQKRRKLREAVEAREKLKKKRVEKKKRSDMEKMEQYESGIRKLEETEKKNAERKRKEKAESGKKTKMLSGTKYQEAELEFNMAGELKGNLRGVAVQGSLLVDRFKSLQKRNVLEPNQRRYVKKRAAKRYEKKEAKMGWEPKGY